MMKIDKETGEIIPTNTMQLADKAPAIIIDVSDVAVYHTEPMKLVDKINAQAGYMVFDVTTKKGREACRAHAAQIIKCIAPACNESKRLASEAKKVVNQDLTFRKMFEAGVREIAEYHRKPLTELEDKEAAIKEAEELAALKLEEARLYMLDWDDAIAFNELFDLRREKAARDAEIEALRKLKEQEEYDRQLQQQAIERERAIIREEEQAKAEAEQAKKLEAALKEQHAEAMARIAEENRIEREKQEKIRIEQHQRDIDIELHERKSFCDSQISTIKKDIEESEQLEAERQAYFDKQALINHERANKIEAERKLEEENEAIKNRIAEPVTISRTEYLKLKGDSAQLWKIIELWHQASRMSECAERAESSSARNKELVEARKVKQQAIDIIENR